MNEDNPREIKLPSPPPFQASRTTVTPSGVALTSNVASSSTQRPNALNRLSRFVKKVTNSNIDQSDRGQYQQIQNREDNTVATYRPPDFGPDIYEGELTEDEMDAINKTLTEIKALVQAGNAVGETTGAVCSTIFSKLTDLAGLLPEEFRTKFGNALDTLKTLREELDKFKEGGEYDAKSIKDGVTALEALLQRPEIPEEIRTQLTNLLNIANNLPTQQNLEEIANNFPTQQVEDILNIAQNLPTQQNLEEIANNFPTQEVEDIHREILPQGVQPVVDPNNMPDNLDPNGDPFAHLGPQSLMRTLRQNNYLLGQAIAVLGNMTRQVNENSADIQNLNRAQLTTNQALIETQNDITLLRGVVQQSNAALSNLGLIPTPIRPEVIKFTPVAYHIVKPNYRLSCGPSFQVNLGEDDLFRNVKGGLMINCSANITPPSPYGEGKGIHGSIEYITSDHAEWKGELGQTDGELYWIAQGTYRSDLGSAGIGVGSKNVIPESIYFELTAPEGKNLPKVSFQQPLYNRNINPPETEFEKIETNFSKVQQNFSQVQQNVNDKFYNFNNLVVKGFQNNNNLVSKGFKETLEKDCCEEIKGRFDNVDQKLEEIGNNASKNVENNLEPLTGVLSALALFSTRKSLLIIIVATTGGLFAGVLYYIIVRASNKIKDKSSFRYIALLSLRIVFSSGAIFTSGIIVINIVGNLVRGLSPFIEGGFLDPQSGISKYVDAVIKKIPETSPVFFDGKVILFFSNIFFVGLYGSHLFCIFLKVSKASNPIIGFYEGLFILVVHLRFVSTVYYIQEFDRTKGNTYLPVLFGLSLKATLNYYISYFKLIKEVIYLMRSKPKPQSDTWKSIN